MVRLHYGVHPIHGKYDFWETRTFDLSMNHIFIFHTYWIFQFEILVANRTSAEYVNIRAYLMRTVGNVFCIFNKLQQINVLNGNNKSGTWEFFSFRSYRVGKRSTNKRAIWIIFSHTQIHAQCTIGFIIFANTFNICKIRTWSSFRSMCGDQLIRFYSFVKR